MDESTAAADGALLALIGAMIRVYGRGPEVLTEFSRVISELIQQTQDPKVSGALMTLETALRELLSHMQ